MKKKYVALFLVLALFLLLTGCSKITNNNYPDGELLIKYDYFSSITKEKALSIVESEIINHPDRYEIDFTNYDAFAYYTANDNWHILLHPKEPTCGGEIVFIVNQENLSVDEIIYGE